MSSTDKIVNNKTTPPHDGSTQGSTQGPTQGPTRRRRRSLEDARENILAAAEAILTARGPLALKLTEVASAAGVANATVLHHFTSIDGVQTALMERMVTELAARVVALTLAAPADQEPGMEGAQALFDTFESQGAARLAAWLVMTGQANRLSVIREAVDKVVQATMARQNIPVPRDAIEDFLLAAITLALGSGLFGQILSHQLGRPSDSARKAALSLLAAQLNAAGIK
jgi:AcrR family transcriptional regulator